MGWEILTHDLNKVASKSCVNDMESNLIPTAVENPTITYTV